MRAFLHFYCILQQHAQPPTRCHTERPRFTWWDSNWGLKSEYKQSHDVDRMWFFFLVTIAEHLWHRAGYRMAQSMQEICPFANKAKIKINNLHFAQNFQVTWQRSICKTHQTTLEVWYYYIKTYIWKMCKTWADRSRKIWPKMRVNMWKPDEEEGTQQEEENICCLC